MRTRLHVMLSTLLAILFAAGAGILVNQEAWAQSQSELVPYTAEAVEVRINADGTERSRRVRTIAHNSGGSRAVHETRYYRSSDGVARQHSVNHIWSAEGRRRVSVYPLIGASVTSTVSEEAVQALRTKPSPDCSGGRGWSPVENTPEQTLAGQSVIVRRRQLETTDRLHSGPVETEWIAPALDCLVMRREVKRLDEQGAVIGEIRMDVTHVTSGAPEADLFALPEDLQEMTPSQVLKAQNGVFGIDCAECVLNSAEIADERYYRNHPSAN